MWVCRGGGHKWVCQGRQVQWPMAIGSQEACTCIHVLGIILTDCGKQACQLLPVSRVSAVTCPLEVWDYSAPGQWTPNTTHKQMWSGMFKPFVQDIVPQRLSGILRECLGPTWSLSARPVHCVSVLCMCIFDDGLGAWSWVYTLLVHPSIYSISMTKPCHLLDLNFSSSSSPANQHLGLLTQKYENIHSLNKYLLGTHPVPNTITYCSEEDGCPIGHRHYTHSYQIVCQFSNWCD